MSFIRGANEWGSAILKWLVICLVVVMIGWGGLSLWGNIAEAVQKNKADPDAPDVKYDIHLTSTGEHLYSDSCLAISDTKYQVAGYYELVKGKWVYCDQVLVLDEFYFGDIEVGRR